jgi:CopG family transcriptional regulator, nickel-responsive regulator
MSDLMRFGVSMDRKLTRQFDRMILKRGYENRSEAIRDMVRKELVRQEWDDPDAEAVGTVTLLFDHHVPELGERLTALQHRQHEAVISTTHVHLTHDYCLEVLVVRGRARDVQRLADQLIATRGVLHGELVATITGETLTGKSRRRHKH